MKQLEGTNQKPKRLAEEDGSNGAGPVIWLLFS
jgi:hypothetical protein